MLFPGFTVNVYEFAVPLNPDLIVVAAFIVPDVGVQPVNLDVYPDTDFVDAVTVLPSCVPYFNVNTLLLTEYVVLGNTI